MVGPDQERWNQVMVEESLMAGCLKPPSLVVTACASTYMAIPLSS
jgi:hypothetical protein